MSTSGMAANFGYYANGEDVAHAMAALLMCGLTQRAPGNALWHVRSWRTQALGSAAHGSPRQENLLGLEGEQ